MNYSTRLLSLMLISATPLMAADALTNKLNDFAKALTSLYNELKGPEEQQPSKEYATVEYSIYAPLLDKDRKSIEKVVTQIKINLGDKGTLTPVDLTKHTSNSKNIDVAHGILIEKVNGLDDQSYLTAMDIRNWKPFDLYDKSPFIIIEKQGSTDTYEIYMELEGTIKTSSSSVEVAPLLLLAKIVSKDEKSLKDAIENANVRASYLPIRVSSINTYKGEELVLKVTLK